MSSSLLSDASLSVLAVAVVLGVYIRLFAGSTSLVHPLLLGKQSELSPTREKGQTGVFRNWATGHGSPLSLRPSNALKTVANVVDQTCVARDIFDVKISNSLLKLRALNLGRGLTTRLDLSTSNGILSLLPDSFDSLLLTLAAASLPEGHRTHVHFLSGPHLLAHLLSLPAAPRVLVLPCKLLQPVLEQLVDEEEEETQSKGSITILVCGSPAELELAVEGRALASSHGVAVYDFRTLEGLGDALGQKEGASTMNGPAESDVLCVCWSEDEASEEPIRIELTHRAIIAGLSANLALFPAHKRPSPTSKDKIASCIPLSQPLGLSIALGCIWSGAGFRTFGPAHGWGSHAEEIEPALDATAPLAELVSLMSPGSAPPTTVFLSSAHLQDLTSAVRTAARRNPLHALAIRHKLSGIFDGHVARSGVWEKLVWKSARSSALGGLVALLKNVVVVNPRLSPAELQASHAYLSLPITRLTTCLFSASPIFLSHFFDLQYIPTASIATSQSTAKEFSFTPSSSARASTHGKNSVHAEVEVSGEGFIHSGPPSINVEVLLKDIDEESMDDSTFDAEGSVWVRGPGTPGGDMAVTKGWIDTGLRARVLKNGTFVVL